MDGEHRGAAWPPAGRDPNRAPELGPIVRPGSAFAVLYHHRLFSSAVFLAAFVAVGTAMVLLVTFAERAAVLSTVILIGLLVGTVQATRVWQRDVVGPPFWSFRGQHINDGPLSVLRDIGSRFQYAKRYVRELPTGIS